jgi:hypothetical protein
VTALEFAIETANVKGTSTPETALAQLTTYLHTGHGMTYDTTSGASGFGTFYTNGNGSFNITNYINKSTTTVNCYDQAAAAFTLGRLLGIDVQYMYMNKFGYINTINLVGVGNCNNPFYSSKTSPYNTPIVGSDDSGRSYFNNHAFAMLGDNVYDACAGPVLGSSFTNYLSSTIDTSTAAELTKSGNISNRVTGVITIILP